MSGTRHGGVHGIVKSGGEKAVIRQQGDHVLLSFPDAQPLPFLLNMRWDTARELALGLMKKAEQAYKESRGETLIRVPVVGAPSILQLAPYSEQKDAQLEYLEGRRDVVGRQAPLAQNERALLLTAKEKLLLDQMRTPTRPHMR